MSDDADFLDGILDSALDGIMAFRAVRDGGGAIRDFEWVRVNPAAEALIGRSEAELVGNRMLQTVPGAESERLCALYASVLETGRPLEH